MNVSNYLSQVNELFSPKVIGEVNDVFVKVAKIHGEKVPWHNHTNEDEAFFIIKGELIFEEENKEPFIMKEGDFYVVKKGINHRVSSTEECHIMLIENKTTAHTGEVDSEITKSVDQQMM